MKTLVILTIMGSLCSASIGQSTDPAPNNFDYKALPKWGVPANAIPYYKLDLGRRIRLGVNSLFRPDSLKWVSLVYKYQITAANQRDLCNRPATGDGLLGIQVDEDVVLVPFEKVTAADCLASSDRYAFISERQEGDGQPVISWDAFRRIPVQ